MRFLVDFYLLENRMQQSYQQSLSSKFSFSKYFYSEKIRLVYATKWKETICQWQKYLLLIFRWWNWIDCRVPPAKSDNGVSLDKRVFSVILPNKNLLATCRFPTDAFFSSTFIFTISFNYVSFEYLYYEYKIGRVYVTI